MLRDTKARWRNRVAFMGVEGGVMPLLIAGVISAFLLWSASEHPSIHAYMLSVLPLALTYSYMWIFLTNRRPHFARDLLMMIGPNTRALTPVPPSRQPAHPSIQRRARAVTQKS